VTKSHPHQWVIRTGAARPDPETVAEFAKYPTTQIADSGGPVSVLGPTIGHRAGGVEVCGPAMTLWTRPGDILFPLKSPDLVQPGDVLVIDGGGREDAAVVGDILSATLSGLGCRGVIVDGAVRDLDGIDEVGLPVYARCAYPTTGSIQGPGALNVPIQCGGVLVDPGDLVRADRSGVVVVPREHLQEVLRLTRAVARREDEWRAAVQAGASLPSATGVDQLISSLRETAEPAAP
jgi:4-hydroxy-4-methyl-2-oxoglutarate aldolase